MNTTISLLNMKGGVGKTTLAVNLAWHMYQNGPNNVLLVDLDPQFNTTQYVMDYTAFDKHRKNNGTIADLLIDRPDLKLKPGKKNAQDKHKTFYNIKKTSKHRFDLLPSELDLAWVVKNPAQMEHKLEKFLESVRDGYDYIIIDCAPTDSVLTTMALTASDFILVPVRPDRFSILGYANLLETIGIFRNNCRDDHRVKEIGIVFTQVTNNSSVEQECMDELKLQAAEQKGYVFTATLDYSNSYIRAVQAQKPIFQTLYARRNSKKAIAEIVKEMLGRIQEIKRHKGN
jgi:chromosome partitioning protein